jgi:hypothetical protein
MGTMEGLGQGKQENWSLISRYGEDEVEPCPSM